MMLTVARWVVVAALLPSCMSPVMQFGEGKSAKQAQRDTMNDFAPARLAGDAKWSGEVSTRKLRVWADNQYRTQNIRWQQSFEGPLELANVVLTPLFGLRLVPEYHVWERHVAGSTLADDLAALAKRDPGDDVFAVVGLTSALPLVSATFDELGYASVGGRHLVVRGYADLEERKLYADAFRDLLPEERELALEQRRHHKTAVVLLHEIAHNLGAEHDPDEDMITSAGYSHRASSFSTHARTVMMQTIDARLGRAAAKPGEREPPSATSEPGAVSKPLVFHVTASGDVLRDDRVLADVDLDKLLGDAFASHRETEIVIKRARKAPTSAIERIVSRATAIGLTRVSMMMY